MTSSKRVAIDFTNNLIEFFGNVPRCRIPRDKQAILIFIDSSRRLNSLIISSVFFFLE